MNRFLTTVSALALLAASPALAGGPMAVDEPRGGQAVSAPNGKIAIFGGGDDEGGVIAGEASYTMPIGHAFGLQFDGLVGDVGRVDDGIAQGAAHLFWRDPSRGLLGLYGSALTVDSSNMFRIGGEGQLYLNRISLEGMIGWDEADDDSSTHLSGTFAYYMSDNTRAYGGVRYEDWRDGSIKGVGTVGFVGFEHQMGWGNDQRGYSLFGEARFGENDYTAAWGGLRIYFGENKSLIRRHREDDPFTVIPDLDKEDPPAVMVLDKDPPAAMDNG